eukprot:CAMPEP_0185584178 /NCGR_PEP_ID=MMETSP0434-20130131/30583_1 /TAXON_ID=626734 ORGANISM="Favella taraikaensis, Strain Fe Narragansett Bay" /NCGR_SAMPLE_ID=MMETSP0434 /ASSEMBLY_ACC=CAM_ASM_000379 /LENGTH=70 /DNA_ID=CAMNT_0028203767 /DNA_START=830 /DNA_END=1042 /DNA_ORIENTATION=-
MPLGSTALEPFVFVPLSEVHRLARLLDEADLASLPRIQSLVIAKNLAAEEPLKSDFTSHLPKLSSGLAAK